MKVGKIYNLYQFVSICSVEFMMLWRLSCFLKQKCKPCGSKAWAPGMICPLVRELLQFTPRTPPLFDPFMKSYSCTTPLLSLIHSWRVIVIECYRSQFTYHATPSSKLPCIEVHPRDTKLYGGMTQEPSLTRPDDHVLQRSHNSCAHNLFFYLLLEGIRRFVCSIIVSFDIKLCKSVGMFAIICCAYSYINIQKISLGWWILDAFLVIIQTVSSSPQKR